MQLYLRNLGWEITIVALVCSWDVGNTRGGNRKKATLFSKEEKIELRCWKLILLHYCFSKWTATSWRSFWIRQRARLYYKLFRKPTSPLSLFKHTIIAVIALIMVKKMLQQPLVAARARNGYRRQENEHTHRQIKEIFGADKGRKGVIDFSRDAACHEVQKKVPAPDADAPT